MIATDDSIVLPSEKTVSPTRERGPWSEQTEAIIVA
jgi:hypothetical protein